MSRHFRWAEPPIDTPEPEPGDLTAQDRCDRCGAQAYHRIEFTASELLFCAHHYRRHKDRLPQTEPAAASGVAGE